MMKIGCCLSYKDKEKIFKAKELGYDYMEGSLASLSAASNDEIAEFKANITEAGLPCPSVNCMFTGGFRLTGPEADFKKAEEYLYRVLELVSPIGIKQAVFGSGGVRGVPEGFSVEAATDQLIEFSSDYIAPAMEKFGMICALEELNSLECNIINTCKQAMEVVKAVNKPSFRLLIDYYHVGRENEPVESFLDYSGYITHVHIASALNKRAYPREGDGEDYKKFFDILRKAGYTNELITIEGNDGGNFIQSSVDSLKLLKSL